MLLSSILIYFLVLCKFNAWLFVFSISHYNWNNQIQFLEFHSICSLVFDQGEALSLFTLYFRFYSLFSPSLYLFFLFPLLPPPYLLVFFHVSLSPSFLPLLVFLSAFPSSSRCPSVLPSALVVSCCGEATISKYYHFLSSAQFQQIVETNIAAFIPNIRNGIGKKQNWLFIRIKQSFIAKKGVLKIDGVSNILLFEN